MNVGAGFVFKVDYSSGAYYVAVFLFCLDAGLFCFAANILT